MSSAQNTEQWLARGLHLDLWRQDLLKPRCSATRPTSSLHGTLVESQL